MNGTLTPAYGRDYKSKKEALIDWNANKDFMLQTYNGGGLINRSQAEQEGISGFQIRWKRMTEVAIIKKGKNGGEWK